MFKLIIAPVEEIKKAVKHVCYSKTLLTLLLSALFLAIAAFIFTYSTKSVADIAFISFGVLFGVIVYALISALIFSIIMHILSDGGYYEALTSIVFGLAAPSLAILLATIFIRISRIGWLLAIIVLLFGSILGTATKWRAAKELFRTDYVTVLIGMMVFITVFMVAMCTVFMFFTPMFFMPFKFL